MADTARQKLTNSGQNSSGIRDNLVVNDNEIMVYLLIWLRWSLSGGLGMHRLLQSERLLASIIIWPRWKAVAHPYAAAPMVTVSQRRGFGSGLLRRCSLLVFAAPADCITLPSICLCARVRVFVRQR